MFGECGQFEERARWAHTICTLARAEGKRMYGILPSVVLCCAVRCREVP